jgi:hypothetical protein
VVLGQQERRGRRFEWQPMFGLEGITSDIVDELGLRNIVW